MCKIECRNKEGLDEETRKLICRKSVNKFCPKFNVQKKKAIYQKHKQIQGAILDQETVKLINRKSVNEVCAELDVQTKKSINKKQVRSVTKYKRSHIENIQWN